MPRDFPQQAPPVWVGHVSILVNDVSQSTPFWRQLGMRLVFEGDSVAVLELRGGTHVVLRRSDEPVVPGTAASFDLMVDDLEQTHARLESAGFEPSPVTAGRIHSSFTVTDPNGYTVKFNSSHVVGVV